ncbi:MAG: 30S ribosomal protein S2 [Flavobacteriales bacterium AspAUS03]
MLEVNIQELLKAGVHFGHLTRKWNPSMQPYIFMKKGGIHIIDLSKTSVKIKEACAPLQRTAASGKKILFVCTKKQGKDIVASYAEKVGMPYVTERWLGGFLTNLPTIRKAVKKMNNIDRKKKDGTYDVLSKKERLLIDRSQTKLDRNLGSIATMTHTPAALLVVDIKKEHIAVAEAQKLNIPIFAIVDTNSNPQEVDYPIPANDDSSKSIDLIMAYVTEAITEGLASRKIDRDKPKSEKEDPDQFMETLEKKGSDPSNSVVSNHK